MWGIKLKGLRRQADLSYSQGYDDDGEDGKDDNVKEDNDKGGMNDKHNLLLVYHVRNQWWIFFFKIIGCHAFSEPQAQV